MAKKKFYAVLKGRKPGIYETWDECKEQTEGFKGSVFKSFKTRAEAQEALKTQSLVLPIAETEVFTLEGVEMNSISVDGACSGNPGIGQYQCVDTKTEEVIFSSSEFKDTTNNIMEFFALVEGLLYLRENNGYKYIYSDSITAMAWVRNKKVSTTLKKTQNNEMTHFLIKKYETIIQDEDLPFEKILKWDTKKLGEIKADFGRK